MDLKDTPLSSPVNYVERIAYNAKGQQLLVAYGNGIMTRYLYRSDNFRLLRLKSEKYTKSGLTYTSNSGIKQNYSYEYDLSGNIINISDTTTDCGYGATPNALSRDFIMMRCTAYSLLQAEKQPLPAQHPGMTYTDRRTKVWHVVTHSNTITINLATYRNCSTLQRVGILQERLTIIRLLIRTNLNPLLLVVTRIISPTM